MAGIYMHAISLATVLVTAFNACGVHASRAALSSGGPLIQDEADRISFASSVRLNAGSVIFDGAAGSYIASVYHRNLLAAQDEGASPIAGGAAVPDKSPISAEQTVADHPTAGVQERQSRSNPKARLLLAANAGGSSSKAGPTPNNAEQMAQNGLKADIAEALNSKGGPTSKKNAGDRH